MVKPYKIKQRQTRDEKIKEEIKNNPLTIYGLSPDVFKSEEDIFGKESLNCSNQNVRQIFDWMEDRLYDSDLSDIEEDSAAEMMHALKIRLLEECKDCDRCKTSVGLSKKELTRKVWVSCPEKDHDEFCLEDLDCDLAESKNRKMRIKFMPKEVL